MRPTKLCLLLAAVLAVAAPAAHAGESTVSPGGPVTATKPLTIEHYVLTVSPFPLWVLNGTRRCDVTLGGTAFTGPIPDDDALMEFASGRLDGCSAPATLSFAGGPWTLTAWTPPSGGNPNGYLRDVRVTMPVGGVTCDYVAGTSMLVGKLSANPILVGSDLFTEYDSDYFPGVTLSYLYSSPRTAACGMIRIDRGDPWLIGPGQTITSRV